MSSVIQYNSASANHKEHQRSFIDRLSDALVYILAFPFIAIFIGMKRVFVRQHDSPKSYRSRLPEGRRNG